MIRDDIKQALVGAMKSGDKARTSTLRLVQAAIKNRDIEVRTSANPPEDDLMVTEVLQKMIKQRRESIEMYEKGNRPELAEIEAAEMAVIETFLPSQMDDGEISATIDSLVEETGASGVKDMGKVMALLKSRHSSQLDMSKASQMVKAKLG